MGASFKAEHMGPSQFLFAKLLFAFLNRRLTALQGVGIEPTRIAPADLKPATLTTRSSSFRRNEDQVLTASAARSSSF